MAYTSTDIAQPDVGQAPAAPDVHAFQTPDVQAVRPGFDSANTGYTAPATQATQHNLDQGLLDYDPTESSNLTFDGRQINASAVGANVNQVTPDFATSDNFLSNGAFVENRMAGLLENPSNPLMQRARASGLSVANSRGMANSTMGATIGETVVADKALQIAGQDATTQATADMNRQTATYGAQRAIQDTENTAALNQQTAQINSALKDQDAGIAWDSNNQRAAIQSDLNRQQANIAGAQTAQQYAYEHDARNHAGLLEGASQQQQANISAELSAMESISSQNLAILQDRLQSARDTTSEQNAAVMEQFRQAQENFRTNMTHQFETAISQAQLNAAQREALGNQMSEMANNYEISVQNILLDPNLSAEAKNSAIERINHVFDQDMANIASIFGATYTDTNTTVPTP